ncbi:autotransporter outer membrane beta-barrel domain-containing protein [Bartonella krasnovii]|nr:right-handed parallel beta-helix repeat-containing protein [Bartonella krasnovii]UNF46547.1 autotransporter outer membrane beta-barrel domain-containing protein [Bartonella krasnovii]
MKLGSTPPSSSSYIATVVVVKGSDSLIELSENTIIGAPLETKTSYGYGISASNNATFKMAGGSINVYANAIDLVGSNGTLENVTITSNYSENNNALIYATSAKNKSKLTLKNVTVTKAKYASIRADAHSDITVSDGSFGGTILAENESTITLNNVTVTQAKNGIFADNKSQITVSGGSFETKEAAIFAQNGSTITLNNNAKITSSEGDGLYAVAEQSKVVMTGGSITGSNNVLSAKDGGYINVKDVALTANANGKGTKFGAFAESSSTIELNGNTTIKNASVGVKAQSNNATIKMTGGSIEITGGDAVGALFSDTKSKENTLKDVKITSGKDGFFIEKGISADKESTVALDNVTVTQAKTGIFVDNKSQITVSGGSFETKNGIIVQNGSTITLNNDAKITSSEGDGLHVVGEQSKAVMTEGSVTGSNNALYAKGGGYINVKDITLKANGEGTNVGAFAIDKNSVIELKGKTTITNAFSGLSAINGSKITSEELTITGPETDDYEDDRLSAGVTAFGSVIELKEKTTIKKVNLGLFAVSNSTIKMVNGTTKENKIEATKNTLFIGNNGHIDLANTSATAGVAGMQFVDFFQDSSNDSNSLQNRDNSEVNLTNTDLIVENGVGISTRASIGKVNLKNSKILADTLFQNVIQKTEPVEMFTLTADHSVLQGGVRNKENGKTNFDLKNETTWTLKISENEKDLEGKLLDIAQRARSDISVLGLNDSSIVFDKPTQDQYQTLAIGSGKPDTESVYNASGNAKIHFNSLWSDGAPIADQKTDRLLIYGDVSGSTTVYVDGDFHNVTVNTSAPHNIRGLSLIQVSGKAEENSFKLAQGYTTINGSPNKYTLRAYGPGSSNGKAEKDQSLLGSGEDFWDSRLQPEFLDPNSGGGSEPGNSSHIPTPVPQMANYLVMPQSIFYTGLTDMDKQNALLANIRNSNLGHEKEKGFFLYTYGNKATFSSARGPLEYGYGADIRYAALQAGVTLGEIEGENTTTNLGLLGTYGQLSFTPKDTRCWKKHSG